MGQKRKNLVLIACSFSAPSDCPQATVALALLQVDTSNHRITAPS